MHVAWRLPLLCFLAAQASCLVEIELDVPEACVTQSAVMIPARDQLTGPMEVVLGREELDAIPAVVIDDAEVKLVRVELDSGEDLGFMNNVKAIVDGVEVLSCDREQCTPSETLDVASHLQAHELKLELAVEGELPDHEWSADVTVCFQSKGSFTVN